jgi:hypothetical protein
VRSGQVVQSAKGPVTCSSLGDFRSLLQPLVAFLPGVLGWTASRKSACGSWTRRERSPAIVNEPSFFPVRQVSPRPGHFSSYHHFYFHFLPNSLDEFCLLALGNATCLSLTTSQPPAKDSSTLCGDRARARPNESPRHPPTP